MSEIECHSDLLSFALSTEFNECSMAAAELRKQVYEALDEKDALQKTLYTVGEDNIVGKRFTLKRLDCQSSTDSGTFYYALIRPADSRAGRQAVLRRAIENSIDIAGHEPQLVAISGEDAYITLGTCVNNGKGNCPYIQFGSEMREPFSTTADENTPRMALIELTRDIIRGEDINQARLDPLVELLNSEIDGRDKELAIAREAQTVRRAYESYESAKSVKKTNLQFIDEQSGEFSMEQASIHTLFQHVEFDNQSINIALAQRGGSLQLLAISRGVIALPLANFDKSTGAIELYSVADEQRKDIINRLHGIIVNKYLPPNVAYNHHQRRKAVDLVIARHLAKQGLIRLRQYTSSYGLDKTRNIDKKEVRRQVDEFIANPSSPQPYETQALTEFTKARDGYNRTPKAVCKMVEVAGRLQSAIGPTSRSEELLLARVQSMARDKTDTFSAIARGVKLGNTTADAKVTAKVERDGTIYNLVISGSPVAMPGEVPRPILRLDFDATQSLFDRAKMTDEEAADKAQQILQILNLF